MFCSKNLIVDIPTVLRKHFGKLLAFNLDELLTYKRPDLGPDIDSTTYDHRAVCFFGYVCVCSPYPSGNPFSLRSSVSFPSSTGFSLS